MAIKVKNTTVIDDNYKLIGLSQSLVSTVTSATEVVLTSSSIYNQVFTGSTAQTIKLPVTSTLSLGWCVLITNSSTANLTVNSSGGNLVITVLPNTSALVTCISISGTTAASWEAGLTNLSAASASQDGFMTKEAYQLFSSQATATVNSVSFTLGTTGSDLTSSVTDPTVNPVITLNVPSASASNRGVLTSADWSLFNSKQSSITATGVLVGSGGGAVAAAVSGTDIKTINGTSLLGSGNLVISAGGGTVTSVSGTLPISVATGTTTPVISMTAATTSVNGYLTSTDWNTFNGKQAALVSGTNIKTVNNTSILGSGNISTVSSVSGTLPISVATGTTTPVISMTAASGSANGYLTSTDWTTFNGKQAALVSGTNIKTVSGKTLLGSGDLGAIGVTYGGTGLTATGTGAVYSTASNSNFSVATLPVAYGGTGSTSLAGAGIITTTGAVQAITNSPTAANQWTLTVTTNNSSTATGAIGIGSIINARSTSSAIYAQVKAGTAGATAVQALALLVDTGYTNRFVQFATGPGTGSAIERASLIWNSGGGTVDLSQSSDYRLKENIVPIDNAIAKLKTLKPVSYDWKNEPESTKGVYGFIAHEFAEVIPYAVVGEKDAVDKDGKIIPQRLDYKHAIPLLTAALQEALARIEALETEVAALKTI